MSQSDENWGRAKIIQESDCPDDAPATVSESAATEGTRMKLRSFPNWTLYQYRRRCVGVMDVKRFDGVDVGGRNFVVHDWNCFQRDTALGAWKQYWAVLS